ncbi:hypothetical protein HMPREF0724_12758 [Prescottella equi ATCC 33707]|uniref:Uncharacterized protein n=1 Tax=Prescottella equi ATCC 33707 TaxID=525370 RepID=E9T2I1_RHOHA|nr:hypothetical protein HMPREF0724_12758 [Prescottella equi ATCC 33707]
MSHVSRVQNLPYEADKAAGFSWRRTDLGYPTASPDTDRYLR